MYFLIDMYLDQWAKSLIFFKFLPGFMVEAQSNLCNSQASLENNQHME